LLKHTSSDFFVILFVFQSVNNRTFV
jgi:hypothetical protein